MRSTEDQRSARKILGRLQNALADHLADAAQAFRVSLGQFGKPLLIAHVLVHILAIGLILVHNLLQLGV